MGSNRKNLLQTRNEKHQERRENIVIEKMGILGKRRGARPGTSQNWKKRGAVEILILLVRNQGGNREPNNKEAAGIRNDRDKMMPNRLETNLKGQEVIEGNPSHLVRAKKGIKTRESSKRNPLNQKGRDLTDANEREDDIITYSIHVKYVFIAKPASN